MNHEAVYRTAPATPGLLNTTVIQFSETVLWTYGLENGPGSATELDPWFIRISQKIHTGNETALIVPTPFLSVVS